MFPFLDAPKRKRGTQAVPQVQKHILEYPIHEGTESEMKPTTPLPKISGSDIEIFKKLVDIQGPGECWPWKGRYTKEGYGLFWVQSEFRDIRAHRLSYLVWKEEDPHPLHILHSCDYPPCCNPNHLAKGTHADNMRDAHSKGRFKHDYYTRHPEMKLLGESACNSRFTNEQIMEIRQYHADHKHEESRRSMSRRYKVTTTHLNAIVSGRLWGHLPLLDPEPINMRGIVMGRTNSRIRGVPKPVLATETILEIRKLLSQSNPPSQDKIAAMVGVSQATISVIARKIRTG